MCFSAVGDISSSMAARGVLDGIGALENDLTIALVTVSATAPSRPGATC